MFMKLNEENTYKVEGATLQNLRRDIVTYSTACSTVGSRRLKYEDVIATNAKNATRMNESDRLLQSNGTRGGAECCCSIMYAALLPYSVYVCTV
jgi:hypothetical protein